MAHKIERRGGEGFPMKSGKAHTQELVMRRILKLLSGGDLSVAELTHRLNSVKWRWLPAGLSSNQVAWLVRRLRHRGAIERVGHLYRITEKEGMHYRARLPARRGGC